MVENVLNFPERSVREWQAMAGALSDEMRQQGHDEATISHVCEQLRPVFLEVVVNSNFSATVKSGEDAVRIVNASFSKVTSGLLVHMARLAIENHDLREQIRKAGL